MNASFLTPSVRKDAFIASNTVVTAPELPCSTRWCPPRFGAGSVFKIFTAAAAPAAGKSTLDSPLPDPSSTCFPRPGRCFSVHNDGNYPDPISLADGLATSPNTAFVGLELRYVQDRPSFRLGDSPVSPLELANVSATLMSHGVWCPPDPVLSVTDRAGHAVPVPAQPCQQWDGG
ncbi:MAG TPA: penicillin-binding transpeptidase domain-containing protein [Actinoplanes sp.]|nr:penicillin-binding transpeptidase domain-containing protein [Actinoplanes sp.]